LKRQVKSELAKSGARAFALYLLIFTQMLDTSVANLALSNIASDLFMDVYYAAWIVTSFGTGVVIAFPLGSIWMKRASPEFVLCAGCIIFVLGSLGCALVADPSAFILFRLVQGIGSGMSVIVSFPIMIGILGESSLAFSVALCTSAISLAPVLGPIVGAYITGEFGWRWLFLMNVPLTCVSTFFLLNAFSFSTPKAVERIGPRLVTLCTFAVCVASFQFALDFGEQYGWLSSPMIAAAVAMALAAGIAFFSINDDPKHQIYDFSVFGCRSYAATTAILVIGNGLIFSSLVFLPQWLRIDRQMPMLNAGVIVSLGSGVAAVATPFIGKYLPKQLYPYAAIASLAFTSLSFFMMSGFTADVSDEYMMASRLVAGCGLAIFATPLITMSLAQLSPGDAVNGNSISIVSRVITSNIFVTLGFAGYRRLGEKAQNQFSVNADRLSYVSGLDASVPVDGYLTGLFHTAALSEIFFATAIFFAVGLLVLLPFAPKMK
jgi:MFS transporter, DHA2 family, multidrug resistance protein